MSAQDEKRAQIIAAQAARQAIADANAPPPKSRSNWAASPGVAPSKRHSFRRNQPGDPK